MTTFLEKCKWVFEDETRCKLFIRLATEKDCVDVIPIFDSIIKNPQSDIAKMPVNPEEEEEESEDEYDDWYDEEPTERDIIMNLIYMIKTVSSDSPRDETLCNECSELSKYIYYDGRTLKKMTIGEIIAKLDPESRLSIIKDLYTTAFQNNITRNLIGPKICQTIQDFDDDHVVYCFPSQEQYERKISSYAHRFILENGYSDAVPGKQYEFRTGDLIRLFGVPSFCKYVFSKGIRRGEECKRPCYIKDQYPYCSVCRKKCRVVEIMKMPVQ